MSEMMQLIEDPNMPKERRKRRVPPPMPTIPQDRIAEVRTLLADLAELYDFGHYDVYDSVFFQRTCEYMAGVSFESAPADGACMRMRDLGTEIILSKSTSTKAFIDFFKSIVDFWNAPS